VYYNVGDSYERHSIGEHGDHCDWIALSQTLLRDVIGDGASESSRPGFSGAFSPIASHHFMAQRRMFDRLAARRNASALEIEETVVPLLKQMHMDARARWTRERGNVRALRPATERERRRIANDVERLIAVNYAEDWSLSDLADQVGCSAGHLARAFRAHTGSSLHEYRNQLRLRTALPMLRDYRHNLSGLALELGFASHSHFGENFRRHFGLTPSDYACRPLSIQSLN